MSTKTHAPLQTKARPSDRDLVEDLRQRVSARKAKQPPKPTVEQVNQIVDDLVARIDLQDTGAKMGLSSQDAGEKLVLDVIATFGTWLAHSAGRAEVEYCYAVADPQPTLFPIGPAEDTEGKVTIPYGYEPTGRHRRDVDKALCTIVHYKPDAAVVSRFVARTYTARQDRLGYPIIAGVWKFAVCGRLATVDRVSDDIGFQEHVLEAFDLLDVAREDAVRAAMSLTGGTPTPEELLLVCDKAYWLDEQGFLALRRSAEVALRNPAAVERCQREAASLGRRIALHQGHYLPEEVSSLTLGQVRRICANAGIRVDPENRAEEAEIRSTLKAMGFSGDADRLVPEALRCAEKGTLDSFWAVMQSRAEGDQSWSEQLADLAR